jgi:hypothetical protein
MKPEKNNRRAIKDVNKTGLIARFSFLEGQKHRVDVL